jgi:hypothetical protein
MEAVGEISIGDEAVVICAAMVGVGVEVAFTTVGAVVEVGV